MTRCGWALPSSSTRATSTDLISKCYGPTLREGAMRRVPSVTVGLLTETPAAGLSYEQIRGNLFFAFRCGVSVPGADIVTHDPAGDTRAGQLRLFILPHLF